MLKDIVIIAVVAIAGIFIGDILFIGPLKVKASKRSKSGNRSTGYGGHSGGFHIQGNNRLDRQEGPSCAGYAAAYLIRSQGQEADGKQIYDSMRKVYKGNVQVVELRRKLKKAGFPTDFIRGDRDSLKEDLEKGRPVILLVRATGKSRELHFLCAVGHDDRGLHLADSAISPENLAKEGELPYNRILPWEDLDIMWNTSSFYMPFHKNTYIALK